jgi:hypothetical protein
MPERNHTGVTSKMNERLHTPREDDDSVCVVVFCPTCWESERDEFEDAS